MVLHATIEIDDHFLSPPTLVRRPSSERIARYLNELDLPTRVHRKLVVLPERAGLSTQRGDRTGPRARTGILPLHFALNLIHHCAARRLLVAPSHQLDCTNDTRSDVGLVRRRCGESPGSRGLPRRTLRELSIGRLLLLLNRHSTSGCALYILHPATACLGENSAIDIPRSRGGSAADLRAHPVG